MYQAMVRRIVLAGFRALSAGEYEHVVRQFHPQVLYSFAGPPLSEVDAEEEKTGDAWWRANRLLFSRHAVYRA